MMVLDKLNRLLSKTKALTVFLLLGTSYMSQPANYISNGSFESLHSNSLTSYYNVVRFWQPIDTNKAMDYLVTLRSPIKNGPTAFGYQMPRSGDNYVISQFFGYRGYPRNRLRKQLEKGKVYCASFHAVNTNNNPYGIDCFGILFADSTLDQITNCNIPITTYTPQVVYNGPGIFKDTLSWVLITGTFVATGYEKYCVLGNFRSNAATNTMVINPTYSLTITADICLDDVSCIDVDLPAYAGKDTVIFLGDSAFLGRLPDVGINEACTWYKLPNLSTPISTIAGMYVKPTSTCTYVVRQQLLCGAAKFDTVIVNLNFVGIQENPFSDLNILVFKKENKIIEIASPSVNFSTQLKYAELVDLQGNITKISKIESKAGNFEFSYFDVEDGIYALRLKGAKGEVLLFRKIALF